MLSSVDSLLLRLRSLSQHSKSGNAVLNFLKGSQDGLPVIRHRASVTGLGKVELGAPATAAENDLGYIGADGPECAGGVEDQSHIPALVTAASGDAEAGIERALGDSDLRVL